MKNLNKALVALLIGGVSVVALDSCKKGENDPMSLKSRDKRIVGTWNLTKSETMDTTNTVTQFPASGSQGAYSETRVKTTSTTSDGSTETMSSNETWNTTRNMGTCTTCPTSKTWTSKVVEAMTLKMVFNEDGTMTWSSTGKSQPNSQTDTYNESPTDANCVTNGGVAGITCNGSYTYTFTGTTDNTSGGKGTWSWADAKKNKVLLNIGSGPAAGTYYIDRLAKDEMIVKRNVSNSSSFSSGNNSTASATTMTFAKAE